MKPFKEYDPALACDIIRKFEGLRLNAYLCPAGVWTIGYGHTQDVKRGDSVTKETAEWLLLADLTNFAQEASALVKVPVSEGQYVALLDFIFNFGITKFKNSTLLKKLNFGDYAGAGAELLKWKYVGGKVLPGLERRRKAEYELFSE